MVNLSSAVQWWEEWQLRILVLGSLFLQLILFAGSMVRNVRIPSFRLCIWLAYLGADALAIYALATFFNRHKLPAAPSGSNKALEVLWAPILLLHLSGQHTFSAYSIEDNELWRRHLVTVVSQVTVALYVFYKSWPGNNDKKLLQGAILLFIAGIFKFILKPLALKSASISSVMASSTLYPPRLRRNTIYDLLFVSHVALNSLADGVATREEEENDLSLEEYVQKARELVQGTDEADDEHEDRRSLDLEKLFVDLSPPYSRRLTKLRSFLKLDRQEADEKLRKDLSFAFGMIYTNIKRVTLSFPGLLLQLLLPWLTLASFVLFATSCKDHYEKNDVIVTTTLFCCTTLLEFLPFFLIPFYWTVGLGVRIWSSTIAQHNLISFYTRTRKPTKLMKFSAIIGCQGYINKHWYIEQASALACSEIAELVIGHVKDGWKDYIVGGASYKMFNSFRGQWTMSRHNLRRRLEEPFDMSVLIWHIATDLCLHHPRTSPSAVVQGSPAHRSRVISNYMIYLLFIRPEMLMAGTRQGLFMAACDDIELMLENLNEPPARDSRSVAQQILRMAGSSSLPIDRMGTLILRSCWLAEDLMEVRSDEEERWKVIQGVWVEMLCYSASKCRGYLHAKSMGEGVEFLTYVWLLLSLMGMETLADKFQRSEPGQGE